MNAWDALISDQPSPRRTILHNIDDIYGNAALTMGKWKVLNYSTYDGQYDGWYGPAGDRNPESYSYENLRQSDAGNILFELGHLPDPVQVK